jgi:hypothetical protein
MEREPPFAAWWEGRERHTGVMARLSPEDYAHRREVCGIWGTAGTDFHAKDAGNTERVLIKCR